MTEATSTTSEPAVADESSDVRRTGVNSAFLKLYFVVCVVAPTILLGWGTTLEESAGTAPGWMMGATRILLFFLVGPVYLVYIFIALKKCFPHENMRALLYVVPVGVTLGFHLLSYGDAVGWLKIWILSSIPLFVGYWICLLCGFAVLVRVKVLGKDSPPIWLDWEAVSFALFLFAICAFPVVMVFAIGLSSSFQAQ